ncbi:MAG: TlpA disulfide reductase family protein, partial [Planctomycetota bacterium]
KEEPAEIESAPPVEIVDLAGLQTALESYRGKAILLNFWATWCAPCVEELPELLEVHQEFRERGGEVVLVSYDLMIPSDGPEAMREKVHAFVDAKGYSMGQLLYDADDYDGINAALQLPGPVPVTLALDAEGREVDRHVEKAGKARFVEMMETVLAASAK